MKQTVLLNTFIILILVVISCSSKPVDDAKGKAIIDQILKLGKADNIRCLDALTNKEIAIKAIKNAGCGARAYSNWVQSDSGQKILQTAIAECMVR